MNTKKQVFTALLCALTCIATMIIKIPTPGMGYIHPGDALVLLCGFLLGPVPGALAAGIGSMLADLLSGYLSYAPATLVIKAMTAFLAGAMMSLFRKTKNHHEIPAAAVCGIIGEAFMVIGYFVFEIFLLAFTSEGSLTRSSLASGAAAAAAGVAFNVVQGLFGTVTAAVLFPLLRKLNLREM